MKKIFSLPLNPKLTLSQFESFIAFVEKYKDYIYDIYFTSRIAPFNQDAMGDVFILEEYHMASIEAAVHVQNITGVSISATFNNIHVPSSQRNLDIFIENFKPLYNAGVRSATIPHTQWVMTGQIQKAFPDLLIKNTILKDTCKANQVYSEAKAGFHYINLDRDLMRDRDELSKISDVKRLFPGLKVSLLANEGCLGNCPIMSEHYQYNCSRTSKDPQYFTSPIARISCQHWDVKDPAVMLKTANLPPWREDWDELLECGIDVFKLHGRESVARLSESMSIIRRYADGDSILFDGFESYIEDNNLIERPIEAWRTLIKNCKFDCWDCNFCDKIYEKKNGSKYSHKAMDLADVIAFHDNVDLDCTDIAGLTSERVRKLLFAIGKMSSSYLEIGCYLGATATAVLDSNISKAYFVDMWEENIQPANDIVLPTNSKDVFIQNVKQHKQSTSIDIFHCDMFDVNTSQMKDIDFFFYDGPHDESTTARAIHYFSDCLADSAVLVFDDANWDGVVSGAQRGIRNSGLHIVYEKVILNDEECSHQWWNGLYVVLVERRK